MTYGYLCSQLACSYFLHLHKYERPGIMKNAVILQIGLKCSGKSGLVRPDDHAITIHVRVLVVGHPHEDKWSICQTTQPNLHTWFIFPDKSAGNLSYHYNGIEQ